MTHQPHFIVSVLRNLQSRAEAAAKRHPGLRHMLVLPPGESIRVPSPPGVRPVGFGSRKQRRTTCRFGETELVGRLPPRSSWPRGIEPLRAVVAGQDFAQEPYRVHLFFGGSSAAFKHLQRLADDLDGIRDDVTRALAGNGTPFLQDVFCTSNDRLHDASATRLDSWLCTVHWWAWFWTDCPFRTRRHVVCAGNTYETDPRDDAVKSKLAFSMFDADVLAASATTLSLILRFFDEPPGLWGSLCYPDIPNADELSPVDVARLAELFIRYVTDYLESDERYDPLAATADPAGHGPPPQAESRKGPKAVDERRNEAAARIRRYGPALSDALTRYGHDPDGVRSVVHCAGPEGGGPKCALLGWEQTKVALQRDVIQLRQADLAPPSQSKAASVRAGTQPPSMPGQAPPTRSQADAATSNDATPTMAEAAAPKRRAKQGRKPKTDPKADERIAEAWSSRQYKTFADLEQRLNLPAGTARRALDRHRKRQ